MRHGSTFDVGCAAMGPNDCWPKAATAETLSTRRGRDPHGPRRHRRAGALGGTGLPTLRPLDRCSFDLQLSLLRLEVSEGREQGQVDEHVDRGPETDVEKRERLRQKQVHQDRELE